MKKIEDLIGSKILVCTGLEDESEHVEITFEDGTRLSLYHEQDCCESVSIYDLDGDTSDLIGGVLLEFREDSNTCDPYPYENPDSYTWTFYNIRTTRGSVNIRWLGESNGYYSEEVTVKID